MNWEKHAATIEYLRLILDATKCRQQQGKASTLEVQSVERTIMVMNRMYTEDWPGGPETR